MLRSLPYQQPKRLHNGCMASITIKGIPEDLHQRLKEQAQENGRSLNQEIINRLRMQASRSPREQAAIQARIDEHLRQQAEAGIWITEEEINRFKHEGRP